MSDTTTIKLAYYVPQAMKSGVWMHPQEYVEMLGLKVISYHFNGPADTAFIEVESLPDGFELPPFIAKRVGFHTHRVNIQVEQENYVLGNIIASDKAYSLHLTEGWPLRMRTECGKTITISIEPK